ncbi:MAG: uroporphyrinogen decarboxylase [Alphaproteobacteria bacterium]
MPPTSEKDRDSKASAKPLLAALRGQISARPPVWLMRQAGRYLPEYREIRSKSGSFLDLCYAPELATEVTLQPIRRFAMDGAILFCDILVVPHAMGQKVSFEEGKGPVLEPVRTREEIARLDAGAVVAKLSPVYKAVGMIAKALPAETALIGFAGAPWTVASYMVEGGTSRDFLALKTLAYSQAAVFEVLIDRLVEASIAHLTAQAAAGAEVLQIFDTWAGILPSDQFEKWCIGPTRRIVEALRKQAPGIPIIGFPRGVGVGYVRYAGETGVDAVGLDTSVPLDWAARNLQDKVVLQGNLDPAMLVAGGAPMREAALGIIDALAGGPFIFNLGHGVVPPTNPDNVADLLSTIRDGSRLGTVRV